MIQGRLPELRLRTPEGVSFALPLAGPFRRASAWLVDLVAIFCLWVGALRLASTVRYFHQSEEVVVIFAYFLLSTCYGLFFEWIWRGQTLGKRVFRMRVMDVRGFALRPGQIVIRNLMRSVDSLPVTYLLGASVCFLGSRFQRLGDIAAGTVVVLHAPAQLPDISALKREHHNSFRDHPHLQARLRNAVSGRIAALCLEALSRRDEFNPALRIELYRELRQLLESRAPFPEDLLYGLTDEAYLRNAVETLYDRPGSLFKPGPAKGPLPLAPEAPALPEISTTSA